jgi:excisionase family DNA binding protein
MKVFTTGQVAKICKVAPRTVSKWFDSGRLKGYRIPGSQDRRIPREYLIKFLKEHGMPLGDLEDEAMAKVLIVAQDQVLIENLKRELPPEKSFKVSLWLPVVSRPVFRPRVFIPTASSSTSRSAKSKPCRSARTCVRIPISGNDSDRVCCRMTDSPMSFDRSSINETFKKPFDASLLAERTSM